MFLSDFTDSPLYVLWVVLIVVACLFVFFLISGIIMWQVLKVMEKKVYKAFDSVSEPVTKLKDELDRSVKLCEKERLHHKKEFFDQFKKAIAEFSTESPKALLPSKDVFDFGVVYVGKVLSELGRSKEDKEQYEALMNARKASEEAILNYSKVAASYNAILSMWPTRLANRLHRKANRRTKIQIF